MPTPEIFFCVGIQESAGDMDVLTAAEYVRLGHFHAMASAWMSPRIVNHCAGLPDLAVQHSD